MSDRSHKKYLTFLGLTELHLHDNDDGIKFRRIAQEDVLLCVYILRTRFRRCEVLFFVAEDCSLFIEGGAILAFLAYVLSDAFFLFHSFEVSFVGLPEPLSLEQGFEPEIPNEVRKVAQKLGVNLAERSRIRHDEGESLYKRLAGIEEKFEALLRQRDVDPARTAFVVNRQIWSLAALHMILTYCSEPEPVLMGTLPLESLFVALPAIMTLRYTILGERLALLVEKGDYSEGREVVYAWQECDILVLKASIEFHLTAVGEVEFSFPGKIPLLVGLCPMTAEEYCLYLPEALDRCSRGDLRVVAVSKDFDWIPREVRDQILRKASRCGISLIRLIDAISDIDDEIIDRIERARSVLNSAPVREE